MSASDYYVVPESALTELKAAIQAKSGGSGSMEFPDDYISEVESIVGGDTSWVTGVFNGDLTFNDAQLGSAFSNATGNFTLTMPNLTTIRDGYTFEYASGIKSFHAPECTSYISGHSFRGSGIETLFVPKATLDSYCCNAAANLVTAVVKGFRGYLNFQNCSLLKTVDIVGSAGSIDNICQTGCPVMDTLILRQTTVATLYTVTSFDSTKFASDGTGGDIYIPKSLYDHLGDNTSSDYKAATNWSTIDGYGTITWHAIEGSYYETHYADGTAIGGGS